MKSTGRGRNDRGANLVEFAFVAPLLFLLLFGVIEFARLAYGYSTIWNGAREGARYATTVGVEDANDTPNFLDCAGIKAAAISKVAGVQLNSGDIDVTYLDASGSPVANCDTNPPFPKPGGANIDSGFTIEVEASGTFDAAVPLLSAFLDGLDMSSRQTRSVHTGVVGG